MATSLKNEDARETRGCSVDDILAEVKLLFDDAPVGMHWVGPDSVIIWANRTELTLLGYSAEEYIGHQIAEFHANQADINEMLEALKSGKVLKNHQSAMLARDGSVRQVLVNSNVHRVDGKFVHTRCFTIDLSPKKEAEFAQAYLAAIVLSSRDAIISQNLSGAITAWNPAAEKLFGYGEAEAVGKHMSLICPYDLQDSQ